jgi:hypothetical protein
MPAAQVVAGGFADRITQSPVTKSRVLAQQESMPHGVIVALFGEAASGKDDLPGRKSMSESKPVAASVKEIKAAYPKAKSEFIIRCMEDEMTMEQVGQEHAKEVEQENETLSAKVAAMEKELADLKAVKACDSQACEKAKEEEPVAKAGVTPVAKAKCASLVSAKAQWLEVVDTNIKSGMDRARAAREANRTHGHLREAMLTEVNN